MSVIVTKDGIKDLADGTEIPCPTCKRKGRVIDPKCIGKPISYCGPNGERFPTVVCRTCKGEGWIIINNVNNQ